MFVLNLDKEYKLGVSLIKVWYIYSAVIESKGVVDLDGLLEERDIRQLLELFLFD